MKIYNYQFQAKNTNATITITIRTDKTEVYANQVAIDEITNALDIPFELWYVEELSVEDY